MTFIDWKERMVLDVAVQVNVSDCYSRWAEDAAYILMFIQDPLANDRIAVELIARERA